LIKNDHVNNIKHNEFHGAKKNCCPIWFRGQVYKAIADVGRSLKSAYPGGQMQVFLKRGWTRDGDILFRASSDQEENRTRFFVRYRKLMATYREELLEVHGKIAKLEKDAHTLGMDPNQPAHPH
jgi:hypothetical protein